MDTRMHVRTCAPKQIDKLRRVLVAYSWYDPVVGYCQGLNRLAAIALLFLEEEDAFWCLVAIVRHILPCDYYDKTLLGSQTDQVCVYVHIHVRGALMHWECVSVRSVCALACVCVCVCNTFCVSLQGTIHAMYM